MKFCFINPLESEDLETSSQPERLRPPAVPGFIPSVLCGHKFFKEYKKSGNFISELPDDRRIGELSIVGTRESISYLLIDDIENRKRQEINIKNQLDSGVHFLDITLYVDSGIIMVSIGDIYIDKAFGEFIFDVNLFLSYHRLELVMIKLKQMFSNSKPYVSDLINKFRENNNGGSRLVTNWGLNDTLGMHRGKILLASEDNLLNNCLHIN
ncbi:Similar to plc: 1-phosphatidylinositol phosphodiesterase (Staphylococcus aureus (strain Newman)) [Cotesia congregata]|uniref:Similar to plc: 1-phosphatidylinositol phosphodiesterase (Staphylococcus aureus (Strain Newman)) n=1 Tax=Cotesia congregata TaxID=51543 RepID=A0A8J2H941_COTCN|nr:Similar to plc: 1-phosphatidylinositol phosphodiesterase (Staphylococcus aureus (strain Newman)) [Cotesia congregata]